MPGHQTPGPPRRSGPAPGPPHARLSPLKARHLNVLGRDAIVASQPGEGLDPLRYPADANGEDTEL
ncbi:MAG: hypothetical protein JO115_06195 [Pseudonocardiales bacterium]|nr:hypothetical protein [Pseudonocardiales bacterium]